MAVIDATLPVTTHLRILCLTCARVNTQTSGELIYKRYDTSQKLNVSPNFASLLY